MNSHASKGFTLIELLVVLSIMGLVTIMVYLVPRDLGENTSLPQTKQLEKYIEWTRWQAIQEAQPIKLARSGKSLSTRQWSQITGNWVKPGDQGLRSTFSAALSIQIENISGSSSDIYPTRNRSKAFFTDENEQFLIFWPDGTSSGGTIVLSSISEEAQYITVTPMGSMQIL